MHNIKLEIVLKTTHRKKQVQSFMEYGVKFLYQTLYNFSLQNQMYLGMLQNLRITFATQIKFLKYVKDGVQNQQL